MIALLSIVLLLVLVGGLLVLRRLLVRRLAAQLAREIAEQEEAERARLAAEAAEREARRAEDARQHAEVLRVVALEREEAARQRSRLERAGVVPPRGLPISDTGNRQQRRAAKAEARRSKSSVR